MGAPSWAWKQPTYPNSLRGALADAGCAVSTCSDTIWGVSRLLAKPGPRILHLHWMHGLSGGALPVLPVMRSGAFSARLLAAQAAGIKLVWTAHNLRSHEVVRPKLDDFVTRLVTTRADAIIAHSDEARRIIIEHFGVDPARVAVILHPGYIDSYPQTVAPQDARERMGVGPDEFVLLFLGIIRPYKGLHQLLHALRQIDEPNLKLRIVGRVRERRDEAPLKALAAQDPRVELSLSYVPDEELQLHFGAADAAVLPYADVLTSGAAVLAMSFGKACIAPRKGCLVDIFAPGGVFHYDSDAPDGLVDAIRSCLAERDSAFERGQANKALAATWTWSSAAEQTLDVYRRIAAGQSVSPE